MTIARVPSNANHIALVEFKVEEDPNSMYATLFRTPKYLLTDEEQDNRARQLETPIGNNTPEGCVGPEQWVQLSPG